MTLDLSLTGVDPTSPVPGIIGEIRYAQGQSAGDLSVTKVLIIAPKTSAGSITADSQVVGPLSDESDIITYTGTGSVAHRMGKRWLSLCKTAKLYFCCPTAATGSAAIEKITVSFTSGSAPTAPGVFTVVIANTPCSYAYTTSDTATTIAAGVKNSILSKSDLPVTASNSSGVLTITGRISGVELNSIRVRASVTVGTNVVSSLNTDIPIGSSGALGAAIGVGDVDYTNVLATILGQKYDVIVPHVQKAVGGSSEVQLTGLLTQVNTQALPSTGFRERVVAGTALTPSNATTLAATLNAARAELFNQEEAPEEHYLVAATCGAVLVSNQASDASYNFDSFGLLEGQVFGLKRPYNDSAVPTGPEIDTMLRNGVSPICVAPNDATYISRAITTRHKDASNNFDYRVRDQHIVVVGDKYLGDVLVVLSQSGWTKITTDPATTTDKQPSKKFATPKRVLARLETLTRSYGDRGLFDPSKIDEILASLQAGIDPLNPSRMNIRTPAYAAVLLHQMQVLVLESSPSI